MILMNFIKILTSISLYKTIGDLRSTYFLIFTNIIMRNVILHFQDF